MTKTEFITKFADKGYTKTDATQTVEDMLETITEVLVTDGKIAIQGFGTLEVKNRAARKGVNPTTGESIDIAASKTVSFKCGKSLKAAVNE